MPRVYDPQRGWVDAPTPGGNGAQGLTLSGNTYVRSSDPNQTVRGQMEGLLSSNSNYMRTNERAGQRFAASRGLLNSTLAGQSGRQAAIAGALPIAQADAQLAAQSASQNMDALNAMGIAELNRQTASASTSMGGNAYNRVENELDADLAEQRQMRIMRLASQLNISEADAGRVFDREMTLGDREFRGVQNELDRGLTREGYDRQSTENERDRTFRGGQSELDRGLTREGRDLDLLNAREDRAAVRSNMDASARQSMFRDVLGMMGNTLFSDPSFWRDPAGASGFLEFFSGEFSNLFSRFFGTAPGGG